MRRSASALAAAGNTLDQSIGILTAIYEVVQDESMTGTSAKTISARLRNSRADLEAVGEDAEGAAESISVLRSEVKALSGVDIMIDDNTFKSTYDIVVELSKVWNNLTDSQRAALTTMIAGNFVCQTPCVYRNMYELHATA